MMTMKCSVGRSTAGDPLDRRDGSAAVVAGWGRLVFVSALGGAPELWAVRPADGVLARLTVGLGGVGHLATFMPQWSPDGDAVAYVAAKVGRGRDLALADGWRRGAPVDLPGRADRGVQLVAGRRWLVVASNAYGVFDIFRVDVPTGRTTPADA